MDRLLVVMGLVAIIYVGGGSVRAQTSGEVPANLVVPGGQPLLLEAVAQGVQIYLCPPAAGNPSGYAWTLRAPEAALLSRRGERIGRHFAGPTWEGNDGSQ